MRDKIFEWMMQSSRRFSDIEIKVFTGPDLIRGERHARRIVPLIEKFKPHTKRLLVRKFPSCSDEVFSQFLEAAIDVEELHFSYDYSPVDREYILQKKFSKLRQLAFDSSQDITGILDQVTDDSLTGFTVWPLQFRFGNRLSAQKYQEFLNRQRNLKQLDVPWGAYPTLVHLALNELRFGARNDSQVASILKNQTSLRRLHIHAPSVIVWHSEVSAEVFEVELKNLRELRVDSGKNANGSILRQVVFLKLVKLSLVVDPKFLMELSRDLKKSAKNVHHLQISTSSVHSINYVPKIIDLFPALKTLHVEGSFTIHEFIQPDTSRTNQTLEELIVGQNDGSDRNSTSFFDAINNCLNLKRIELRGVHNRNILDSVSELRSRA